MGLAGDSHHIQPQRYFGANLGVDPEKVPSSVDDARSLGSIRAPLDGPQSVSMSISLVLKMRNAIEGGRDTSSASLLYRAGL